MKKIPSFTIDHLHLLRGIYVSRKDYIGNNVVTTFDIRMKEPNREPALGQGALHTIEHLAATFLPEGPQLFPRDAVTDQPERQIVAEVIREKALHALNEEIPHGIAVSVDKMKVRKGKKIIDIDATIVCEKDSHKGIIIGKQGSMLKKIGSNARYEIERLLDAKVNLQLWVKVKKDWRDSDFLIKNFGYRKDEM